MSTTTATTGNTISELENALSSSHLQNTYSPLEVEALLKLRIIQNKMTHYLNLLSAVWERLDPLLTEVEISSDLVNLQIILDSFTILDLKNQEEILLKLLENYYQRSQDVYNSYIRGFSSSWKSGNSTSNSPQNPSEFSAIELINGIMDNIAKLHGTIRKK